MYTIIITNRRRIVINLVKFKRADESGEFEMRL